MSTRYARGSRRYNPALENMASAHADRMRVSGDMTNRAGLQTNSVNRPMLGSLSEELDRLDEKDAAGDRRLDNFLTATIRRTNADMAKLEKGWADAADAEAMKKKKEIETASYMCKVFGLCAVGLGAAAAAASHFSKGGNNKKTKRRRDGAYNKRTMRKRIRKHATRRRRR